MKFDPHQGTGSANNENVPFLAPPLVNPNDPNMVLMAPPDYVYNFDNNNMYNHNQTVSPRTASTMPNGYPPNTFGPSGNGSGQQGVNHTGMRYSPGQQHPQVANAGQQSQGQPFSPMSSSSGGQGGGYDWYAIDVNPLLHNNSVSSNGMQAGLWNNIFGPELGDGLEMLGTLADNPPFDDSVFSTNWNGS